MYIKAGQAMEDAFCPLAKEKCKPYDCAWAVSANKYVQTCAAAVIAAVMSNYAGLKIINTEVDDGGKKVDD